MKKLLFAALAAGMFAITACGQKIKESEVPAAVKSAFEKQYPGIKSNWEKEGKNYEVNFKQENKSMSAVIDKNGTILETETDIAITDLPQGARDYVKDHYKGAKIKEASKIVKSTGELSYEALVNGTDVIFDATGKFMRTAKE